MHSQRFKKEFWSQVGGFEQILPLLDSLHDVAFFFKDLKSRHTMNNARAVASAGVASEEKTLGKIGYEFWYPERLALFMKQDQEVMRTGIPIINALCPTPERGSNAIIVFSKIALRGKAGEIVGLAGVWRETDSVQALPAAYGRFSAILEYIHAQYAESISVANLASELGLSRSQFSRSFRQLFGLSPYDYLKSVRVNAAALRMRETEMSMTEIALDTGFYDHSHFSKVFKSIMGLSPRDYRKKHGFRRLPVGSST